ncbi:MAG: hypothetical protein QXD66_07295 [Candidatus Nezhaarchaeales archaeon]
MLHEERFNITKVLAHSMVVDYWELVSIWGPIGVSLFTFAISLVPFVSPSNALMAMLIAMSFPNMNKLAIGLSVALGATLAKTVHFTAFYGLGKVVDKKAGRKRVMSRYGRLIMYIMNIIAAATPIPDEWIVIPLGLTQASFIWFATTYFIGKLVITIPSAYIGHAIAPLVMEAFGRGTWMFSVVIGIAITAIFIFVDVEKASLKVLRKLGIIHDEQLKQSTQLE